MTGTPTIRQAQPSDCAAIAACARAAYHHYINRIGKPPAPMIADFATQISENKVQVLTVERQVVGYVVSYPRSKENVTANEPADGRCAFFLENIAVDPSQQRSGYGALLLSQVEVMARESGCSCIELYTNEMMVENLSWYASLGFTETGRRFEAGFNRVYMRLDLVG